MIIAKHLVCQVFFGVEFSSPSFAQVVSKFSNFSPLWWNFCPLATPKKNRKFVFQVPTIHTDGTKSEHSTPPPPPKHPLLTRPQNPLNTLPDFWTQQMFQQTIICPQTTSGNYQMFCWHSQKSSQKLLVRFVTCQSIGQGSGASFPFFII